MKETKIIDCECDGFTCCGGRGIAVFLVERDGKDMKVCTKCDLVGDKNKRILKYVKKIPWQKLLDFDVLGAFCLSSYLNDKTYPLV